MKRSFDANSGNDNGKIKRAGVAAAYVSAAPTLERDQPEQCTSCGSDDVVEDWRQGHLTCRSCGLILSEKLFDLGSEWRTFTNDDSGADPNRVGGPSNPLYEADRGTSIGSGERNALNAALNRAQNSKNQMTEADKTLRAAEERIGTIAERGNLPRRVQDAALTIFKRYMDFLTLKPDMKTRSRALRNEEKEDIIAAAIHISCGMEGIPRGLREVCGLTDVPLNRIATTRKHITKNLEGLERSQMQSLQDLIPRPCSNLNLPPQYVEYVGHLATKASEMEKVYGKTYQTIVAACLLIMTNLSQEEYRRTPRQIATVVGVAEATTRSCMRDIIPHLKNGLLHPDFTPAEPVESLMR
mmetsp:Transcript_7547/g.15351  ORF Transcript_7547/g.15351 Transcript_7547/m.15351 type:complete len:355 (-) Transcript_7547:3911-4975(-)